MDQSLADQLLTSIESDRLVIICGAGLSMAPPSCVPGAVQLAKEASAKYRLLGRVLPAGIEDDLSKLAEFFLHKSMLPDFISKFIDWAPFRGVPNNGHQAIADFLACGVVDCVVTTNFDYLVEEAAGSMGEPNFQSSIKVEDLALPTDHKPYLKIHGCLVKEWGKTLWCEDQLTSDPLLEKRIKSLEQWLSATLQARDFLVIGFWTDWDYLHSVLDRAISATRPNRVVLVDKDTLTNLTGKAPELMKWATEAAASFHHEKVSGSDFLSELRWRLGRAYFCELLSESIPSYLTTLGAAAPLSFPNISLLTDIDLFELRRDSAGLPVGSVPRCKRPEATMRIFGVLHLAFASHDAVLEGTRYVLNDRRYRIVQGAGRLLSEVKKSFDKEPTEALVTDVVVCAGAVDDGGVTSVVRAGTPGGIIRPGTSARWITTDEAFRELGV